jgi:hypothetical protein
MEQLGITAPAIWSWPIDGLEMIEPPFGELALLLGVDHGRSMDEQVFDAKRVIATFPIGC